MNRNSKNLKILQMIVGTEAFQQIINQLQGESIYISSFSCYPSKQERDQALKDVAKGTPITYQYVRAKHAKALQHFSEANPTLEPFDF